jgi:hypothetical protein
VQATPEPEAATPEPQAEASPAAGGEADSGETEESNVTEATNEGE